MSSIVIANFKTGYETDREPFIVDNDAFPILNNIYLFRGRARKKRGTSFLGRLTIALTTQSLGNTDGSGNFSGNIFSILGISSSAPNANLKLGSITISVSTNNFTEPSPPNGTLSGSTGGTGTLNYATGALTLTGTGHNTTAVTISFSYYPALPVMGIEDFEIPNLTATAGNINFPTVVYFDTQKSYQFNQGTNTFYDVTFYKNSGAPFSWSAPDYAQFWSTTYQGALWVTNAKAGFQFKTMQAITYVSATVANIQINAHGLALNDYLFINEVTGTDASTINFQSGSVTTVTDANHVQVTFPNATIGAGLASTNGIAQYMTRSVSGTQDGIRWYDGDPIASANATGWVNFAPPLSRATNPQYLVGAKMIVPFKDQLLFFGPYEQGSTGNAFYYPNRVYASQNGTAYYSLPVPANGAQTADPSAYLQDVAARGFRLAVPVQQEIVTVGINEDVLICGYEGRQFKLISTGDSTLPFLFQTINSELGAQSTYSGINLDYGKIDIGDYGIALTTQQTAQRIDLVIPDQIFDINIANNGSQRVTSVRDFRNEFIYFTYPSATGLSLSPGRTTGNWIYPTKTLLYNYRENNYSVLNECYTHYGNFRYSSGRTWATLPYKTWAEWTDPWEFGASSARYPQIAGGNQQGFILIKDSGTKEANSLFVSGISGVTITCPNHCLNDGDYIIISGALGDPGITAINGLVYQIFVDYTLPNTFTLEPTTSQPVPSGTYLGGGLISRNTNFLLQTKQFPAYWEQHRKTRLGTQRYLLGTTGSGQITANIYTSQNAAIPVNDIMNSDQVIYSNVVLTTDEPNNPYSQGQAQIWHRSSNSFQGDTVQVGLTLSDAQMRTQGQYDADVDLHAIVLDVYPGPILC